MIDVAALVESLERPWRHGEHVDARNLVLEKPLILDGLEIRGIDLTGAVLRGGLSARGTHFRGLAWLRNVQIPGDCNLSCAEFRTDLRADGMQARTVLMKNCVVQGCLSLAGSKMNDLGLENALVMANMTLEKAEIRKSVNLAGAEIMGGLWTAGAKIGSLNDTGALFSGRVFIEDPRLSFSQDLGRSHRHSP